jgi:uncharacterized damage-inducible protein DinB
MPSLASIALADLRHEAAQTRKMLERVPADRWDWKPHDKSGSLGQIASHIARLPIWGQNMTESDSFDFTNPGKFATMPLATNPTEAVAHFDANLAPVLDAIASMDDTTAMEPYQLRRGEMVVYEAPRVGAIRHWLANHLVHHRGQLSVYLRLIDAPVPGMYGPSADEK